MKFNLDIQLFAEDEMPTGTVIKHYDVAIFIKDKEQYFRQEKTTTLNVVIDTETEEKHFIADVNPTEFPKSSKISLDNDLYTIKGNKDFEFFFAKYLEIVKKQPAPLDILVVYKAFGSKSLGYKGWHFPQAQLMIKDYDAKASTLNYTFSFGQGELGTITSLDGTPTFQKDA